MKKVISLILALALCLPLCACGEKSNEIELTLDNYEQYLDVSATALLKEDYESDNSFYIGYDSKNNCNCVTETFGQNVYGYIWVEGLSQNFNYNNIEIKVELTGKCYHLDLNADSDNNTSTLSWSPFKFVTKCNKVDITDKGSGEGTWALPSGRGIPKFDYWNNVRLIYDPGDFLEYEYKVVSVSGTVTPA